MKKVTRRDRVSAEHINQIIDAVNPVLNLTTGPGLELRKTGVAYHLHLNKLARGGTTGAESTTDDPTGLAWLQGTRDTDSWTRGGETPTPVSFHVLTDIKFNDTDDEALTLTMRSRTLLFDTAGALYSVSAEDEYETTITTAVLCAESP